MASRESCDRPTPIAHQRAAWFRHFLSSRKLRQPNVACLVGTARPLIMRKSSTRRTLPWLLG
jgi:hypothetical protein